MRRTVTGWLVSARIIDIVHNLWQLTLMNEDDLASIGRYKVQSKYPFRNDEIRRFRLTFKGETVIRTETLN